MSFWFPQGAPALAEAARSNPGVMLLDLGLPDMDGAEVIRAVRQWSMMFIIVVSARSEEDDKVAALDAGADDYLTKPFSVEELLARLRAALRRVRYDRDRGSHDENSFENGVLFLDYAAGSVTVAGKEIHLAPMEYKLLCLLAHNVGKVLTYRFILQTVWGNALDQNLPSLRVFMATLRKKPGAGLPAMQLHQDPCGSGLSHDSRGRRQYGKLDRETGGRASPSWPPFARFKRLFSTASPFRERLRTARAIRRREHPAPFRTARQWPPVRRRERCIPAMCRC